MQLEKIDACNQQAFFFALDPAIPRTRRRPGKAPRHAQTPVQVSEIASPRRNHAEIIGQRDGPVNGPDVQPVQTQAATPLGRLVPARGASG